MTIELCILQQQKHHKLVKLNSFDDSWPRQKNFQSLLSNENIKYRISML